MRWKKTITVVGAHAEGDVGNVVIGGIVDVPGKTMWEKKQYIEQHLDNIRQLLLFEPRGAPYHAVNYLLPSTHPHADLGFVIAEAGKYPPMSGSNTICVATVILETGILAMQEPVTRFTLESPAGLIEVTCLCSNGKVTQVEFKNVPSFLMHADRIVEVESIGVVKVDIAYGGIIYAITDAGSLGFQVSADESRDMVFLGQKIRKACNEQCVSVHPENPQINKVSNVIFAGPLEHSGDRVVSKNATMCNLGRLDRSPCGTGSAAILAVMNAKAKIKVNEIFESISITGTKFICRIVETCKIGDVRGIIPAIAGQAWVTGLMQYGIDPTDPFQQGHKLPDVWLS